MATVNRIIALFIFLLLPLAASPTARAQAGAQIGSPHDGGQATTGTDGISLAPARFELEMAPGSETTVVVNLDYHSAQPRAQASRLVASLNDWTMSAEGEVKFHRAGTQANSASPWMIYSPAEVSVRPGNIHPIRVTISVPRDARPGDHLASLIVEQRPDTIKLQQDAKQMLVRFRMAAMFYIKVPQLTRRASLQNLKAAVGPEGIVITPTLKNEGNSLVRPMTSVKVVDASGLTVAELPESESLPVLAGSELTRRLVIQKRLAPGTYTVSYRVDFQGHSKAIEGLTDLIVRDGAEISSARAHNGQ